MNPDLFVTGTDTAVGKTLLSALLVVSLSRKYWKPIQTGACEGTDRQAVIRWAAITADDTYPETYLFEPPVSPHLAAKQQGTNIDIQRIRRPASVQPLVIEGAGGVFVPINEKAFMLDLMCQLGATVIVASRTALGTINHTLLTVSAIRQANLSLRGVVMIGRQNEENRLAIERYGDVPVIGWIPWLDKIERGILRSVFENRFDRNAFL